jgi:hypothetical protein
MVFLGELTYPGLLFYMKELKFQYIKFTMPLGPAEITEATDT